MLDRLDWDTYWRWEIFRRRCDPLDVRRWKRDSSRGLRSVFTDSGPAPRLLDSTAGLGDHAVNLADVGFRVEACDPSAIARDATTRALAETGHRDVPVFDARWETLGRTHAGRYDLVWNDALHWIHDADELHAALRGLHDALRPGGALVFFFADEAEPEEHAGLRSMQWDLERMPRAELAWDHTHEDTTVSLAVVNQPGDDFVDQHHLYTVRTGGGRATLDVLTMRRVYRWDWYALSRALERAGFVRPRSEHFENVKGYTFALNLAFRP